MTKLLFNKRILKEQGAIFEKFKIKNIHLKINILSHHILS